MKFTYFDIHSHLNDPRFDADIDATLLRMREAGVASIVVGTDRVMSERAVALAEKHQDIWATIGVHPTDNHTEVFDESHYRKLAEHPKVVAIGECGLDYYWPASDGWINGEANEKKRQWELFEMQITIALQVGKPLMIHGRPTKGTMDAYEDIISILKKHPGIRGNVHFFVGNIAIAKQFCELGFTMSFTGVLTFSHDYDEVVGFLPLESIMSETDAPYVAPKMHRGKRNEPAFVVETIQAIKKLRKEEAELVERTLRENAHRIFGV